MIFETGVVKAMLVGDGYKPDSTHTTRADVLAFEVTGDGYEAGGVEVECETRQDKAVTSMWVEPVRFPNVTIKGAKHMVLYDWSATVSEDTDKDNAPKQPLIGCVTLKGTKDVAGKTLKVTIPNNTLSSIKNL